jgi:hypothetical protein
MHSTLGVSSFRSNRSETRTAQNAPATRPVIEVMKVGTKIFPLAFPDLDLKSKLIAAWTGQKDKESNEFIVLLGHFAVESPKTAINDSIKVTLPTFRLLAQAVLQQTSPVQLACKARNMFIPIDDHYPLNPLAIQEFFPEPLFRSVHVQNKRVISMGPAKRALEIWGHKVDLSVLATKDETNNDEYDEDNVYERENDLPFYEQMQSEKEEPETHVDEAQSSDSWDEEDPHSEDLIEIQEEEDLDLSSRFIVISDDEEEEVEPLSRGKRKRDSAPIVPTFANADMFFALMAKQGQKTRMPQAKRQKRY